MENTLRRYFTFKTKKGDKTVDTNKKDVDLDFLKLQYQVLSSKQISHNSLVWNAPSLLFVAQTFLWDISLKSEIDIVIRCCVSLMSILVAFSSLQYFIRNRLMEIADCEQLRAIELLMKERTDVVCPAMIVSHKLTERTLITSDGKKKEKLEKTVKENSFYKKHPLSHRKTFPIWEYMLKVVFILSIILFFYNVFLAIGVLPTPQCISN